MVAWQLADTIPCVMKPTRRDSMLGNNISCLQMHSLFVVCQPPINKLCAFGHFNIKQSLSFQILSVLLQNINNKYYNNVHFPG